MKRSASAGMCSPRSANSSWISAANKASSGRSMRATGVTASRVLRSGSCGAQAGGALVGDHDQRPAAVLRLVPGVEQLLLVAPLGIVEQAPADPLDEAAREQRAARAPRAGEDRRLDRPQAPLAEMLERRRGWRRTRMNRASPSLCGQSSGSAIWSGPRFTALLLGCVGRLVRLRRRVGLRRRRRRRKRAAAGPLLDRIRTTVPPTSTVQPRAAQRRRQIARSLPR